MLVFLSIARQVTFLIEEKVGDAFLVVLGDLFVADWFNGAIIQPDPATTTGVVDVTSVVAASCILAVMVNHCKI